MHSDDSEEELPSYFESHKSSQKSLKLSASKYTCPPSPKSSQMSSAKEASSCGKAASQGKECHCTCSKNNHSCSFGVPPPWWSMPCFPPYYKAPFPMHSAVHYPEHQFPIPRPEARVYKSTPPKVWNALSYTGMTKWEPKKAEKNDEGMDQKSCGQSDFVKIDPEIYIKKQGTFIGVTVTGF